MGNLVKVCELAIFDGYYDGHAFFSLCWNMIVRCDTVALCNYTHISWRGDCLKIKIPKEKTRQQSGPVKGDSHDVHVYSNTANPAVCVFLALGVKLLCTDAVDSRGRLFALSNIHDRYVYK